MDARAWDERYAASELVWSATPNQFVASELAGLKPGRAADLAAGEGRNALWLAEQGWEVTAVDFSLAGLDKGRALQERHERGRDLHVDWVHGDVLTFESGPVPYDLVVLAYLQLDRGRAPDRRTTGVRGVARGRHVLPGRPRHTNLTEGTGGPHRRLGALHRRGGARRPRRRALRGRVRAERVRRVVPDADPAAQHTGRRGADGLRRPRPRWSAPADGFSPAARAGGRRVRA